MAANGTAPGPPAGPPDLSLIPVPISPAAVELARSFAGSTIALNVILAFLFAGRIWTRTYPVFRMGWDDYLAVIAYPLVITDSVLLLRTVPYGFGANPNTITLADIQVYIRLGVISQPIWAWSMCTIKVSVTAMLLRLETQKFWRRFLWGMIAVQLALAIYLTFALLLQCVPLSATWDILKLKPHKCWSDRSIRASSMGSSAVNVITDIILALLPINFLRKVQRPMRERVIIGMLMALGVFAASASIVKMRVAADWSTTGNGDVMKESVSISMWTVLEELVGMIAACIPCLRSPFQKVLVRFGLASESHKSTYGRGYGQMYGDETTRTKGTRSDGLHGTIKMKTLRSEDAQSEENILSPTGVNGLKAGEIWCTTEVKMQEEVASSKQDLQAASEHSQEDGPWSGNKVNKSNIV